MALQKGEVGQVDVTHFGCQEVVQAGANTNGDYDMGVINRIRTG